ncbi:MAG: acyltransferase family protein [Crocinitomicaceae bacterium]|nr:acyltransferase family protein [Crocinitomicaceae bacterium]
MSTRSLKKNEPWIDNARALATICVILLHVASDLLYTIKKDGPTTDWWTGNILDGLTRFCVPLFFMISGALILRSDYGLIKYLKKRFVRIVPPLLFWSLVYLFYDNLIYEVKVESVMEFIRVSVKALIQKPNFSQYHLWFVYTMIGLYLIVPIIRKWIKHSTGKEVLYFIIIWGITIIAGNPYLHKYIPEIELLYFTGHLGFMVLGYYLTTINSKNHLLAVALIVIGAFATIYGTYYESEAIGKYSGIYYHYLSINVVAFALGVFLLVKNTTIKSNILNKIIKVISDHSFGIYLAHVLVLVIFERNGLKISVMNPWLSIPLITIACLLCSLLIIFVLRLIKYGKYISG